MESKIKTGGAAFPRIDTEYSTAQSGMSLRDYFAAAALQGMAASHYWSENFQKMKPEFVKEVAETAFVMANAMIAQREKGVGL